MSFPQEQPVSPVNWGGVHVELYFSNVGADNRGRIQILITYSDGSTQQKSFDLLERLQDDAGGQAHLSNLLSLKNYIIDRIENELLP